MIIIRKRIIFILGSRKKDEFDMTVELHLEEMKSTICIINPTSWGEREKGLESAQCW